MQRKTIKIDRDPQLDLLGDPVTESTGKHRYGVSSRRVFVAPDRRELYLGQTRVDQYLEQAGLRVPLTVARLLDDYVWDEFEARYGSSGRAPYAPQAMVGVILYGTLQGISSLRALEKFARTDLGCLWISGGICPDHASLGRFIVQHQASFSDELFRQITASALAATNSDGRRVAGDGSIIEASCSHYSLLHEEAIKANAASKKKALAKEPNNHRLRAQAELAEQAQQHFDERKKRRIRKADSTATLVVSPIEPEAVVQRLKSNRGRKAGYKPSVLSNEKRIIVAHAVDPSKEASLVDGLLEQSHRVSGTQVDTLMLDGGYFCDSVLETAINRQINLLCPGKQDADTTKRGKKFAKHEFRYDESSDVYICPAGEHLKPGPIGKKTYRMYRTPACKNCPLRAQCTSAGAGRRIRRQAEDEAKEAQRTVMSHPRAKEEYKYRMAMVEPVFSYLQNVQRLKRFKRRGLRGVTVEFAIHATAYNLSRAVAALVAATVIFYLDLSHWRQPAT